MTVMPIGCLREFRTSDNAGFESSLTPSSQVEVIGYAFRLYSHSDVAARSPYIGQLGKQSTSFLRNHFLSQN